jgi:hypothetical protein
MAALAKDGLTAVRFIPITHRQLPDHGVGGHQSDASASNSQTTIYAA